MAHLVAHSAIQYIGSRALGHPHRVEQLGPPSQGVAAFHVASWPTASGAQLGAWPEGGEG